MSHASRQRERARMEGRETLVKPSEDVRFQRGKTVVAENVPYFRQRSLAVILPQNREAGMRWHPNEKGVVKKQDKRHKIVKPE